jgi:glycosyltransferase involved in cell wall biosynthesis
MACGLAVVATEAGGAAELVADGSSGRLVPVGEPELLAAAIRELLVDAGLRARLGRAARERVSEGLGWDACIGRSLELLAPLLS